ncbi:hypothetical protein [Streptomyces rapamycinicus]|uniref:Lipoprotein n=2 Tax=Streptomyces rapamycinicus TaxID=1226757 RepID=A0A0A0NHE5_STRRN|nr:hypothetical protein [Streptomyces rapamycinicus]AGP56651.1 hypothetical protein M271_25835 [Streptomyces rapamycinicus NRRL 5491]MBB4784256.1 hypothetical protein [Streptomyces rapamycinicus]RLV80260.1 hypothetical protein D3C57_117785 [Streptomyces rapamycinicus NRRL 5491]UTO64582.1 hypothetical protein LJB45_21120 [Streptomyces rapamycinicus]UTP32538.1 hypothetical protein LIV37_26245 [Streptomyces rapamycinicus NRRL 5491]
MNTTTNRFRGRAGRRIAAALVAAAALSLGATACGPDDSGADSSGSSASAQPTSGSSSDNSGSQGQNGGKQGQGGGKTDTAPPAAGNGGGKGGGNGGGNGGGAANAGNHRMYVGTLKYLAPGKMTIKPESGGMEQAFLISNATKILGAAAICSDDGGTVSIGDDGYGTSKCTVEQLEKAAKTNSVTVRVTMNPKSGAAETVEEKYHP